MDSVTAGKMRKKEKKALSPHAKVTRFWLVTVLCVSLLTLIFSMIFFNFDENHKDDIVIVLDPGHGGADVGAVNSSLGLYESEINLKIALACRDYLEKYDGVRVYMTHIGVSSRQGESPLLSRVNVAREVGADIFISLHINSANSKTANGAEVYVPHTDRKPEYNEKCTELAEKILEEFQSLGLSSRGVKTRKSGGGRTYTYDDGTTEIGDYYYVVGEPIRRLGIPGILVEHAFIDGDSEFLDSDEELIALGEADARAIAEYYGLELKDEYKALSASSDVSSDVTPNVLSNPVDVSSDADNESFASEEDADDEVVAVEQLIRALPDSPTASNHDAIQAAKDGFNALDDSQKALIETELYQKLCNVVTAYANLTHPVRLAVKQGSELSVNRVSDSLLNVETAAQASGKITMFSIMLELELYIDPSAPDKYKDESKLNCQITAPDGTQLDYDDVVPNGSTISVSYEGKVLDSLKLVINE